MMKLLCILGALSVFCPSNGNICHYKSFFRGRPRDGFLPKPSLELVRKADRDPGISAGYFTQRLDHFNFNSQAMKSWPQLYYSNSKYYKPGGPLFVMIGGEGPISSGFMDMPWDWVKNGKIYGAYLLQLEHRYYGKSHPTSDTSVPNLKWLSSEQALADLANFITTMKQKLKMPTAKVIVFGGSYPGNLAAWFRLKYPQIADGAIASSAPVWAKPDFYEYLEVVGASLDYVTPGCQSVVKTAFNKLSAAVSANSASLTQLFGLCSPITNGNAMNLATFYESVIGFFQGAVQYNRMGPHSRVLAICNHMMNGSMGATPLQRLASIFNPHPNQPVDPNQCMDFSYLNQINFFKNTSWSADGVGSRMWLYQTCSQFGYYQTTDSSNQPFGPHMNLAFEEQLCMDLYGIIPQTLTIAIQETNTNYGSRNLTASKIVLVNGSVDPWHALGILSSKGTAEIAEFYPGGSHCYDMYGPDEYDTQALQKVRLAISQQIGLFLKS